jgi:hypothetical protein
MVTFRYCYLKPLFYHYFTCLDWPDWVVASAYFTFEPFAPTATRPTHACCLLSHCFLTNLNYFAASAAVD